MSMDNRNKALVGFGALVVILVAAIALWPPNFRKEEASGAIGAVQKHHAPQITPKDVILGDEKTRRQQKVLYADFLTDASKLQSIAAELRSEAAAQRTASITQELSAFENDLATRYASEFSEALAAVEVAARNSAARDNMMAEIQEMGSRLHSRNSLSNEDMQALNTRLAHVAQEANVRTMSSILADADTQLGQAAADLASAKALDATAKLDMVTKELSEAENASRISLNDEVQYLQEMQMASRVINEAEQALAHRQVGDQEVAGRLMESAKNLESRAVQNIEAAFAAESEMASRLNDMDAQLAQARGSVASRADIAASRDVLSRSIQGVSAQLSARESEFNATASAAIQTELNVIGEYMSNRGQLGVAELQNALQAMEQQLESKNALTAALSDEAQLASQARDLASRTAQARTQQ